MGEKFKFCRSLPLLGSEEGSFPRHQGRVLGLVISFPFERPHVLEDESGKHIYPSKVIRFCSGLLLGCAHMRWAALSFGATWASHASNAVYFQTA